MPIQDDEKRRAYFREYMRRRRAGAGTDAEALRRLRASDAERPADDELARRIRETHAKIERSNDEWIRNIHELLPLVGTLVKEHDKLIDDYNELAADYNELLDELGVEAPEED
jgi:hypothetical protein